jgi:hypothetical protein
MFNIAGAVKDCVITVYDCRKRQISSLCLCVDVDGYQ